MTGPAALSIFCGCGSYGGTFLELRTGGKRIVCQWCHATVWPPTVRVLAQAAALVHRIPGEPEGRRRASRKR